MRKDTNNYAEHIDNLDLAQKLATHISKENPRAHARRLVSCAPLKREEEVLADKPLLTTSQSQCPASRHWHQLDRLRFLVDRGTGKV